MRPRECVKHRLGGFAFDILQERVNLVSVIVRVSKCVRLCAANLIYCYNRELFVATVAGDL